MFKNKFRKDFHFVLNEMEQVDKVFSTNFLKSFQASNTTVFDLSKNSLVANKTSISRTNYGTF